MNLRAYLTILRPGRTLFAAALFVGFVYLWLSTLFHAPAPEALWLTLALFGPAVLGILLLGPLDEVMHRSVFPLLPDARRQLRRWHLRALTVTAIILFVPAVIFADTIPAAALLGLIVAGLSLPLLNSRHRVMGQLRLHSLLLILGGIALAATGRPALIAACQHAPWAVLIAGFALAYGCFRIGFSVTHTGNRWRDPAQFCLQSTLPFVGTDISLLVGQQMRQQTHEGNDQTARDWNTAAVGPSLRDWVRVTHHARFGNMSRLRHLVQFGFGGIIMVPLMLGVFFAMAKIISADTTFAEIYRMLATAGRNFGRITRPESGMVFILSPLAAYGFALLAAVTAATPALAFPIARERLAGSLFLDATRLVVAVYAANFLGTALSLYVASQIAGETFEPAMLHKLLAAYAVLPPTILFGLGVLLLRHGFARFMGANAYGLVCVLAVVGANHLFTDFVLSPLGWLSCIAATAVSVWLSWLAMRRHFRTCNLLQTGGSLLKLGIGIA